jgi:hypothetical protein
VTREHAKPNGRLDQRDAHYQRQPGRTGQVAERFVDVEEPFRLLVDAEIEVAR